MHLLVCFGNGFCQCLVFVDFIFLAFAVPVTKTFQIVCEVLNSCLGQEGQSGSNPGVVSNVVSANVLPNEYSWAL